jgi:sugar/nucleoside kinase (ribokinase family)
MNSGVRALARIVVIGSVAGDEVVRLTTPLRAGANLNGNRAGARFGGGGANTAVALATAGHHAIGEALL